MSDASKVQLEKLEMFQEPRCLIQTGAAGSLALVKSTVDELMLVDKAVNVVAIAGLYRTGKSYLMNRLAGEKSGFALGTSIQSKTKGIWVWCKYHPTQKDQVLLLLDTEGLGDVEKGNIDHDNKLFVLAALLSSTLVYNMMTSFNQDALEKLMFITNMSKNLQMSEKDSSDDNFDILMPEFVLCIRDFTLDLEIDGRECSEDEYLENCLKEKKKSDEKYNRTRSCIRKYFTRRKAFTFDRPASRKVMKELDKVKDKDLSEDFINETKKFTSYIYECPPKILQNKKMVTGRMLAELLTVYITAITDGKVPCIDDALTVMYKAENKTLVGNAIKEFKEKLGQIPIPVANKELLLATCSKLQTEILADLKTTLLYDDDHREERSAKEQMDDLYKETEEENSKQLFKKCYDLLSKLYEQEIKGNVSSGKYMVAGGYDKYKKDMDSIIGKYKIQLVQEQVDQMESDKAEKQFLASKTDMAHTIMTKDNELEKQQNEEEKRRREDELRQKQELERQSEREAFESFSELQSTLFRLQMTIAENRRKLRPLEYELSILTREFENARLRQEVRELNQRRIEEDSGCTVS